MLSILFELGGCDARDDYYKGYDDAIDLIEREVLKLKEINFDDTCENIKYIIERGKIIVFYFK